MGPKPTARAARRSSVEETGRPLRVVGEHVGQAHERRVAADPVGVVALDPRGDAGRHVPAADQDAPDHRVIDPELVALLFDALLGRAGAAVHLARVARVGVHEHELADVVQQRGDQQAVAMRVAGLGGEAVGRPLDGDGVQAEALGSGVPGLAALEELEGLGRGGQPLHRGGREHLDGCHDVVHLAAAGAVDPVGEPQHGDHQRDVGLDRRHHVADRRAVLGDQGEQPIARLRERREDLEGVEGRGEPLAVALVRRPADDRVRLRGCGDGGGGDGLGHEVGAAGWRAFTTYRHLRWKG